MKPTKKTQMHPSIAFLEEMTRLTLHARRIAREQKQTDRADPDESNDEIVDWLESVK
jgi:hypothetical protein